MNRSRRIFQKLLARKVKWNECLSWIEAGPVEEVGRSICNGAAGTPEVLTNRSEFFGLGSQVLLLLWIFLYA